MNAVLGTDGALLNASVLTQRMWLAADASGIQHQCIGACSSASLRITEKQGVRRARVRGQNVVIGLDVTTASGPQLQISLRDGCASVGRQAAWCWELSRLRLWQRLCSCMCRFASPLGILGQSHRNPLDASAAERLALHSSAAWQPWRIPEPHALLSLAAPGQAWSFQFAAPVYSNVMRLRAHELPSDTFDTEVELGASRDFHSRLVLVPLSHGQKHALYHKAQPLQSACMQLLFGSACCTSIRFSSTHVRPWSCTEQTPSSCTTLHAKACNCQESSSLVAVTLFSFRVLFMSSVHVMLPAQCLANS